MLEKLKQMMQAFLSSVGDGATIESVSLSSEYTNLGADATALSMQLSVGFTTEQKKAEIPAPRDGGLH